MTELDHRHRWRPVSTAPQTIEQIESDDLLMRALPMPARFTVLCDMCGAVEYQ